MAKKLFKDLAAATMSPEAIARAKERAEQMSHEMLIEDVRCARRLAHESLEQPTPARVAELERNVDRYLAAFRARIEAMGGQLEVTATFPQGEVQIIEFSMLDRNPEEWKRVKVCAP
jgi:hypothetical protein